MTLRPGAEWQTAGRDGPPRDRQPLPRPSGRGYWSIETVKVVDAVLGRITGASERQE